MTPLKSGGTQHVRHVSVAGGLFCLATTAWSQALPVGNETDDAWRYSFTPYAYIPLSIEGTSVIADTGIELDLGFDDAIDLLDFAMSGRTEIWKGDWGIIADFYYVDLSLDGDVDLPGPGDATAGVDIGITQKWAALMGSYRFAKGTYGHTNRRFAFDAGAGVRWNSIKQEVDADIDVGGEPGVQTTLGGTETWWEPTVMFRGVYEVGMTGLWAAAWSLEVLASMMMSCNTPFYSVQNGKGGKERRSVSATCFSGSTMKQSGPMANLHTTSINTGHLRG